MYIILHQKQLVNPVLNLNPNYFRIIIFTSLCAFFLIHSSSLFSQVEDEDVSYQGWVDYNANYHVSREFKIYGDVGYRRISPDIWTRYYIRPAVSYFHSLPLKSGKYLTITYHFGIGTFFTNAVDTSNNLEIRPFQGVDVQWPTFKHLQITHYVRLEEMLNYFNSDWDLSLRVRYMFSGIFHWNRENWNRLNNFYMPFHIEFFWDLNTAFLSNDLIRITPGLGYTFNLKWKMEFSTSYHRTRIDVDNPFETNNIVFRLRVFHNILK